MTNEEVQLLTEQLSLEYFQKAFLHQAYFNPRLKTTGGRYLLTTHHIELNKKSYELHGLEELKGIIKHELAHYHLHLEGKGYKHRDVDFKQLIAKVGAPRYCKPIEKRKKRTEKADKVYQCKTCNTIYKRKRRIDVTKYRCSKCFSEIFLV
ncbi:MAG: SprT family protein [Bacillaceae bacterium]